MKTIEIRRHSIRSKPGDHLSQQGVTLARLVGENLGPFDKVITSTLPRAFETAIAMGFAVDEQLELLGNTGDDVQDEVPWPQTFEVYAKAFKRGDAVTKYGRKLARLYGEVADFLADSRSALIINHGGVAEIGALACFVGTGVEVQGEALEPCEGIRLYYDDKKVVRAEILRISK
jgi:broad specificity phosphatase PhoE